MSGSLAGLAAAALGFGTIGGTFARFLRPASIRGVGFWIIAGEDATVRRWVTHEFPGRDDPWHEDLGAGPAAFEIEGLLIGDDVARQVERLRSAAAAAGPARLVHPWYGTMQVAVLGCAVSLAVSEGRVARFKLKAERFGPKPAPALGGGLLGRLLDAVDAIADQLAEALAPIQAAIAQADQAVGLVLGIAGGLAGAASRGISAAGISGLLASTATGRAIAALEALTPGEAASPATVAARVDAVAVAVAALPATAGATANAPVAVLLALATDTTLVPVPTDRSTATNAALADLLAALAAAIATLFAARAAAAAAAATWQAREDALADRDSLADALDGAAEQAAALGWDEAWRAIITLRAVTLAEISARAAPLPRIRQALLPATLSASLLAYRLDGDALATVFDRGTAIAARNRARHPGFLPAGQVIEVLL